MRWAPATLAHQQTVVPELPYLIAGANGKQLMSNPEISSVH
jgi:hypothetical protein